MHIRFNHFPFTVNSREMSDDHDVIVDDDDAVDEKLKILNFHLMISQWRGDGKS